MNNSKEHLRSELINMVAPHLSLDELRAYCNQLDIRLNSYEIEEKERNLVLYDDSNDRIIKTFIASMRLEGLSEGTLDQYYSAATILCEDIGKPLREITTNDIRYHLSRYAETVSKVSVNNKRSYLSALYNWLTIEGYILVNPMLRIHRIKTDTIIKKPYSVEELEKLRGAAKNRRERALLEFLLSTGCRVSEVADTKISDIDFGKCELYVFGKGSKERKVYISDLCMYYLKLYLGNRKHPESEYLFPNRYGERITKEGLERTIREIGKRAGVSNVHPHRFRRTFATWSMNRGMSVQVVQRILGHTKIDTTMLYSTVDDAVAKMEHQRIA